ncbi:beta-galactosidase-like [Arachis duranensis]|uniref:beta-galactosidase n=1 Tax=Arachis duranensis TaxID=130453 RepID=A0A9C6TKN0_ARADU|nr:beta-galactosidase-like [Arachis duranensis]
MFVLNGITVGFLCGFIISPVLRFEPNNPNSPKMWTENWIGWYVYLSLSPTTLYNFQTGGTFQNYDMYHGGTNFDRTAGGPYIATSYDYDAPLDEYGNKAQPKWGHLKELHRILKSMEESLTNGNVFQIHGHCVCLKQIIKLLLDQCQHYHRCYCLI